MPAININDERAVRLHKLAQLQEQGVNPYPSITARTHSIVDALAAAQGASMTIAGRIMRKREMGKLIFCHLSDGSASMQAVLKADTIDEASFDRFASLIDIADFIEVTGERFVTARGEESVLVSSWQLLSKALRPLPDKFHGLQDEEARYRKRYLDFVMNDEARDKIVIRGNVLRYMRQFLYDKGFIEVETPLLETVASGAMARTFDTFLNAYNLPVHLRICIGELWQKRLLVGGFEKTFEIGRAFRNEGVDHQHNPEFTMIEYYWAYASAVDNMALHQEMIPYIIKNSVGDLHIQLDDLDIDFTPPYPSITFRDAVKEKTGIDLNEYPSEASLRNVMKEKGYETEGVVGRGKLLDSLFKETTRPFIIQPTFVLDYPIELKPLAKMAADPLYTNMFQLIVNGFELSNSYTELNDPIDQRARFEEQAKDAAAGDDEAMQNDWDYVDALEHGMPPATGTGIGIDRFVALITGSHTLREIMAFPLMKPEGAKENATTRSKGTMVAHAVILDTPDRPLWSKYNAVAHLAAAFAAREGRSLIWHDHSITTDGEKIPMNIQHAIMIQRADSSADLLALKRVAQQCGLVVSCFTQDMLDTTNDNKVKEAQDAKAADDVTFVGILVFGDKKKVAEVTKGFSLVSA